MAVKVIFQAANGATSSITYDEGDSWTNDEHNNLHVLDGSGKIGSHKNNRWLDVVLEDSKRSD